MHNPLHSPTRQWNDWANKPFRDQSSYKICIRFIFCTGQFTHFISWIGSLKREALLGHEIIYSTVLHVIVIVNNGYLSKWSQLLLRLKTLTEKRIDPTCHAWLDKYSVHLMSFMWSFVIECSRLTNEVCEMCVVKRNVAESITYMTSEFHRQVS